jgi:DNA polymerase
MTPTTTTPQLTALQAAWLQELGLPKAMLKKYSPRALPGLPKPVPDAPGPSSVASNLSVVPPSPMPAQPDSGPSRLREVVGQTAKDRPSSRQGEPVAAGVAVPVVATAAGDLPADLAGLEASAQQCRACPLFEGRSHVVFGSGVRQSPALMVIGEAPGDQDDRTGLPFQGDAGHLLEQMLHAAGVDPSESVYFANLVKCRPLGNKPPSEEEIAACLPFLRRQIALVKPKRLMVLGRVAARVLAGSDADFDQLRADVHVYRTQEGDAVPMLISYHPAYLLLQPQHKLDAWRDLNRLKDVMAEGAVGGSGS